MWPRRIASLFLQPPRSGAVMPVASPGASENVASRGTEFRRDASENSLGSKEPTRQQEIQVPILPAGPILEKKNLAHLLGARIKCDRGLALCGDHFGGRLPLPISLLERRRWAPARLQVLRA